MPRTGTNMPALSQSLTFTINSSTLTSLVYPNTGTTALEYSSNPVKGDGYFGNSDGLHTVQVKLTNFNGSVAVQGTLATAPSENDWFNMRLEDGTGNTVTSIDLNTATSAINCYNFTGNIVWVRANINNWTAGAVNGIQINH
jgi:hypothetical protein